MVEVDGQLVAKEVQQSQAATERKDMVSPRVRARKAGLAPRASATLRWGLVCFLAAQLFCIALLEWRKPEFYDPKYGCRLNLLRARLAREPERKILVVLGSSRSEQGFRPSLLPSRRPDGEGTVVYNLARGGASPVTNLVTLRRLLADGVHPDWVLLEIFPPSLAEDKTGVTLAKTTLRDFPVLSPYPKSWKTYAYFLRDRALLWSKYRSGLLCSLASSWVSPSARWEELWEARGGEWRVIGEGITLPEYRRLIADARRRYYKKLQNFRVAAEADRATRALLELCRQQHIGALLFLMPEASEFRRWYTPPAQRRLCDYLTAICREYGTPLIDARDWVPDEDFWDGHHLLQHGAATFMLRFGEEVLQPLVQDGSKPGSSDLFDAADQDGRISSIDETR